MNRSILASIAAASALVFASQAHATIIDYTIEGVGSGTFGGRTFDDSAFAIHMVGDTDDFDGSTINPLNSSVVSVDGIGAGTLLIGTRLGYYGGDRSSPASAYFSRAGATGLDLLDFYVNNSVDLTQGFGPMQGQVFNLAQFSDISSTMGDLTLTSASYVTFSAAPLVTPVPEPTSAALLLAGALALPALRRRKD